MIIEIDESFKKDFKKIKNLDYEKRIINKLDIIESIDSVYDISNIKVMKGFSDFYRIRIGQYRIGFRLDGNKIILLRVRNRDEIYNIFP